MFIFIEALTWSGVVLLGFFLVAGLISILTCYRKVEQGKALVRNGMGGTHVSFAGIIVFPVIHRCELIDISVKRVEIDRQGKNGLICQDNLRADIKVAFFVRVNKTPEDVLKVAQSVGCERASSRDAMVELFDSKFSEALKTVGRQFNFVDLYNSRDKLKEGILRTIGTDLNGFVLDDVAIDFLEQTPITLLNPDNILDSEGIKRITELTATQKVLANRFDNEREKTITKQNVETKEAVLEMQKQLAEAEQKQKREIATITAREEAESKKVQEEQRLKSEQTRIAVEEELQIATQNKDRQIIVAQRNKERTDAVEKERVEKDRLVEVTERERIVSLARISRDREVEIQQKDIQNVIRDRLEVEKTVVLEKQRIADTEAFATADREKKVALTAAEKEAESALVKNIKAAEAAKRSAEIRAEQDLFTAVRHAEADKQSAEKHAQQKLITADAEEISATKFAGAKKQMAEATAAEAAAIGLGEVRVLEARAVATEKQGAAEAKVSQLKYTAEANGITEKADAMKKFHDAGREHEEFKLRLNKDKEIELASLRTQQDIASSQAEVMAEAMKHARIDIVGGDGQFFERITGAIGAGKAVDRLVQNSRVLTEVKDTFFNSDPDHFRSQVTTFVDRFGMTSEDLKNLTLSALLGQMMALADEKTKGPLSALIGQANRMGIGDNLASVFAGKDGAKNG